MNLGAAAALLAFVTRRGGRRVGLSLALLLVGHLVAGGPAMLADPWNPYVTVLPLGLLLALASAEPRGAVLVALTAIGSFLVQSHVGFAPVVAAIGLVTAIRAVRSARDGVPTRRAIWASLGLAALLWAPPVLEELRGHPGNLSSVAAFFAEQKGHHTLAEVLVPLARHVARAPFGVATAIVPSTSDDRGTGSGLLTLLLVALLPLAVSASQRAGRRFERNLGLVTLLALLVAYVSLVRVVDEIHDYLIVWLSVAGALGWALVVAAIPELGRAGARRVLIATLAVVAALAVRVGTLQLRRSPPAALRTIPRIDELAGAAQRFVANSGVRRPLLVLATHDAWPASLGVVLELTKRGVPVSIPEEWVVMFGPPLCATGVEDGALVLAEEAFDRVMAARPDAVRLAARDGIVLYGLKGAPSRDSRRSGDLQQGSRSGGTPAD